MLEQSVQGVDHYAGRRMPTVLLAEGLRWGRHEGAEGPVSGSCHLPR